ncbi:MAG: 50S ribosomal protein L11 methyltransferase [Defluviicoccus sp.]|nr:50S ribosomal protein L11 methyltransferase [Defluviicoccus sp.]MDE0385403.1 50S ribosomal protein L11 methyltransferase [Defluviicoccus sp.]
MSTGPETGAGGWSAEIFLAELDDDDRALALFEAALEDPAGVCAVSRLRDGTAGGWTLRAVSEAPPDEAALGVRLAVAAAASGMDAPSVSVAPLAATDWVAEVQRNTLPIRAGRFFVRGTHVTGRSPCGTVEIVLDAGRAFGTGSHESTRGCLLALDRARTPGAGAILDLGTGSGILAIAAAKLWRLPVIAADSDPVSVATACANAALNGVDGLVETRRSRGFSNPLLRGRAPFGLILANILAGPLMRLAPGIARNLHDDGRAILSGLLSEQAAAVAEVYEGFGLPVRFRHRVDGWTTLVVGRE